MRRPPTDRISFSIQAVFDPDGMGGDLAYTIGLADAGYHELHMWARPTHGLDPGLDYKLSPRDCGSLLHGAADRLMAGTLAPGSQFTVEFDGGLCHGQFVLGEPVDPDEVEAYGVPDGALVIPMRWELHRPPGLRSPSL